MIDTTFVKSTVVSNLFLASYINIEEGVREMADRPSLNWLTDPGVFAENRLSAHSDHVYYETMEEAISAAPNIRT